MQNPSSDSKKPIPPPRDVGRNRNPVRPIPSSPRNVPQVTQLRECSASGSSVGRPAVPSRRINPPALSQMKPPNSMPNINVRPHHRTEPAPKPRPAPPIPSARPPIEAPNYRPPVPKKKSRRKEILEEILQTERGFVSSLRFLVHAYVEPLEASKILTPAEMSKLFSSIVLIVNVNQELLDSLEKRFGDEVSPEQCVGDVFLELAPFLKLYNQYSANYDDAIKALDLYKLEKERFSSFLDEVAATGEGQHPDVSFYLIMPIQRIPRYILLLSDLLKETPSDHSDQELVSRALEKIREVASNVNNSIREAEQITKIVQIQSDLIGYDQLLIPTRQFIRESAVMKISTKGDLLPRILFVFNDIILLTQKKAGKQYLKQLVPIHLTWAKPLPDAEKYENVLQLISNSKTVVLTTTTASIRDSLVQEISAIRSQRVNSSEGLASERAAVESCLQPRLHAKLFQIDEYVAPLMSSREHNNNTPDKPQRAMKRSRNATTMIERLSSAADMDSSMISTLFPLVELSDDALQKFSEAATTTNNALSPRNGAEQTSESTGNRSRREKEVRLHALHKAIRIGGNDIVQPEFYGYLTKQGGVRLSWKKRWFVLKARFLCYYKTRQDDNPAGIITLRGCCISDASRVSNKPNSLRIVRPDARTYTMYAATPEEIQQWIQILQEVSQKDSSEYFDHTCITALIFYLFSENTANIVNRDAAWWLTYYLSDVGTDSQVIEYLCTPSSYKPLKKLISAPPGIATPIQVALLQKLRALALIEEVGKSLIAQGFIDCLYAHLEHATSDTETTITPPSELQIQIAVLLSSLSKFDFFPCSSALRQIFSWLRVETEQEMLYHIATIFRNVCPFPEFRKMVVQHNGLQNVYACLACGNEDTIEKLLQGLLLLICDDRQCEYSSKLLISACHKTLNPLVQLLYNPSTKYQWVLVKLMNTFSAVEPALLQSMDITCAPQLIQLFVSDPNPVHSSLVFELTRFFNMMSRNQWIRGTLDNNDSFTQQLIHIISHSEEKSLKELALRCLGNMCTSDKNKIAVHSMGVDVLMNQLYVDDTRVRQKALHCISYALMNDKNKVAFATDKFAEILYDLMMLKDKPMKQLCLMVLESANSPHCFLLAEKMAKPSHIKVLLKLLKSMEDNLRDSCTRAVACLAYSDKFKDLLVEGGCVPILINLLSDNTTTATHAVGALGNLFLSSPIKQTNMSAEILQKFFNLLSAATTVQLQKAILQSLTCIVHEDESWAEQLYQHPQFSIIRGIDTTEVDLIVRNQLAQLFSAIGSLVRGADLPDLRNTNVKVNLVPYRPRFEGYKIV